MAGIGLAHQLRLQRIKVRHRDTLHDDNARTAVGGQGRMDQESQRVVSLVVSSYPAPQYSLHRRSSSDTTLRHTPHDTRGPHATRVTVARLAIPTTVHREPLIHISKSNSPGKRREDPHTLGVTFEVTYTPRLHTKHPHTTRKARASVA